MAFVLEPEAYEPGAGPPPDAAAAAGTSSDTTTPATAPAPGARPPVHTTPKPRANLLAYSQVWDTPRRARAASQSNKQHAISLLRRAARNSAGAAAAAGGASSSSEPPPSTTATAPAAPAMSAVATTTQGPAGARTGPPRASASLNDPSPATPANQLPPRPLRPHLSAGVRMLRAESAPASTAAVRNAMTSSAAAAPDDRAASPRARTFMAAVRQPSLSQDGMGDGDFVSQGIRMRRAWQRDDTARWCAGCGEAFSLLLRKHHCRCCGRVFCSQCSNDFVTVPTEWRASNGSGAMEPWHARLRKFFTGNGKERVCSTCRDDVALLQDPYVSRALTWLRACSYTSSLELPDLVCVVDHVGPTMSGPGCRGWRQAANLLRSELRPLQYKLPTEGFSYKERCLLWGNRRALAGHTQWLVPLMVAADWGDPCQAAEALAILNALLPDALRSSSGSSSGAEIHRPPGSSVPRDAIPGRHDWNLCMDGMQFVSCACTMCSHTCQGFRLAAGTARQVLGPADALRLLSLCPMSTQEARVRERERRAQTYVRDLEAWRVQAETARNGSKTIAASVGRLSSPSVSFSSAASSSSAGSTGSAGSVAAQCRGPRRAWAVGSRSGKCAYLAKITKRMQRRVARVDGTVGERQEDDISVLFLSVECRRRIVGVLRLLFVKCQRSMRKRIAKRQAAAEAAAKAGDEGTAAPTSSSSSTAAAVAAVAAAVPMSTKTQELLCYIPQLVYCLRFSPPLPRSPLADFLVEVARDGGPVLRHQVFWSLEVAANAVDPAGPGICAALNGQTGAVAPETVGTGTLFQKSRGGLWAAQERQFRGKCRSLLLRLIAEVGREASARLIAGQRLVESLVLFSRDAARISVGDLAPACDGSNGRGGNDAHKLFAASEMTASRRGGRVLAQMLQHRLEFEGIVPGSRNEAEMEGSLSSGLIECPNVLAPEYGLRAVSTRAGNRVAVLQSNSLPMVVPFDTTTTSTSGVSATSTVSSAGGRPFKLLVKSEDVRTDLVMLNCIRMMDIIVKRELGEDLGLLTYRVVPTSPAAGLIEFVQGAVTLEEITRKWGSYRAYFEHCAAKRKDRDRPKHEALESIKRRFMRSLAGYSVATFLLGVGDRHTKNMMVTEDGTYFHIDFGYVLGQDPKPLQPPVRVTPMEEAALGTRDGSLYKAFIALTIRVFNCVRHHVGLFTTLLLPLTMDSHLTGCRMRSWESGVGGGVAGLSWRNNVRDMRRRGASASSRRGASVTGSMRSRDRGSGGGLSAKSTGVNTSGDMSIMSINASSAAAASGSCRFTRRYLLEQVRVRFLPGMSDPEAEQTLRLKLRREHVGADLETAARVANDTYRHQRDTLKIQKTVHRIQAAAGFTAGVVGTTATTAGRVVTRGLVSAWSGLLGGVNAALGGADEEDSHRGGTPPSAARRSRSSSDGAASKASSEEWELVEEGGEAEKKM